MTDHLPAPALRIGDAERDRAADALGAHLRAGRLDAAEYEDRIQQAYDARTAVELSPLFADLPGGLPDRAPAAVGRFERGPLVPVRAVLLAALVLAAIAWTATTHLPPFFLFPLVFLVGMRQLSATHRNTAGPGPWRRYSRI